MKLSQDFFRLEYTRLEGSVIDVCKLMSGMEIMKRNQLFSVSQNKNHQTVPVQNKQGEMVLMFVICFMEILTKKHC